MKKNPCALLYCALAVALSLTACLKSDPVVLATEPGAKIVQLKELDQTHYADSFRVYYNSLFNPTLIKPSVVASGYPMWLYRYDSQDRLIARIGSYSDLQTFEMAYRYVYNTAGRISQDTAYAFGEFDTTVTPIGIGGSHLQRLRTTDYVYDSLNRIIQADTKDLGTFAPLFRTVINYSYNGSGNAWKIQKIVSEMTGTIGMQPDTTITYPSYDNKNNFRQLNTIWQFVDRDYSRNNINNVATYDTYGFPTTLQSPAFILGILFQRGGIRYEYVP